MKAEKIKDRYLNFEYAPKARDYVCPQVGFQEKVLACNTDFLLCGGAAGGGKSVALLLSAAYGFTDEYFRGIFIRNTLKDIKSQGGLVDEAKKIYPSDLGTWRETDPAQFITTFGAITEFGHVQDQRMKTIEQIWKGRQLTFIGIDEITGIEFPTFTYLFSRNRSPLSALKPRVVATCNPSSTHWIRSFIDWYIGEDGFIRKDRAGMVRYFYIAGNKVDSIIWGNSKKEVYDKAAYSIDPKINKMNHAGGMKLTYNDFIKSFTFIEGVLSENKELLGDNNTGYIGSLAMQGDVISAQLLEGNWNVNSESGEEILSSESLTALFANDPQTRNERYITVDMALKGKDSMVIYVWYGFHLMDAEVVEHCESDAAVTVIKRMQVKHSIGNKNVIYDDGGLGAFLSGMIKGSQSFLFNGKVKNSENYVNLKSQCFDKMATRIINKGYSVEPSVADRLFRSAGSREKRSLREWLFYERRAFRWDAKSENGKYGLINKPAMRAIIGKSPDYWDAFLMREYPELVTHYSINHSYRLINL